MRKGGTDHSAPPLGRREKPWLALPWSEPIPSNHLAPARQFVIEVLEKNVGSLVLFLQYVHLLTYIFI